MAEKAAVRDEQNSRLTFAAENPTGDVLARFNTNLTGLDEESVSLSRSVNGTNKVTKEKKNRSHSVWREHL